MHSYLRAIGFSEYKYDEDVRDVLEDVFHDYDERNSASNGTVAFVEMSKSYGHDMGITICGEMDAYGFHREYYFPYFKGNGVTTMENISVEKRNSQNSYIGACDDNRVGVSLIFSLQNAADYENFNYQDMVLGYQTPTTFSGLSIDGKVLLPIIEREPDPEDKRFSVQKKSRLLAAAKRGDEEAIESLTMEDIDTYSMLSRRIREEDVFSIVETFFMPFGMECDQYQILGIIRNVVKVTNIETKEEIFQLNLDCNGLNFDICINTKDLLGEPEIGRRFKGVILLQGKLNFNL